MLINFTKMHGNGNDFIVIDNIDKKYTCPSFSKLAKNYCQRHFSIGADQLILIEKSPKADGKMLVYNADGSQAENCGNALRCIAKLLLEIRCKSKGKINIETTDSVIEVEKKGEFFFTVMGTYSLDPKKIGIKTTRNKFIDYPIKTSFGKIEITCISMGNPHTCLFVEDVDNIPLEKWGKEIEKVPIFENKTNVEFIQIKDRKNLIVRIWERGSGKTLSCGSGVSASVVASVIKKISPRNEQITVQTPGGILKVIVDHNNLVTLIGKANIAFQGVIDDK